MSKSDLNTMITKLIKKRFSKLGHFFYPEPDGVDSKTLSRKETHFARYISMSILLQFYIVS